MDIINNNIKSFAISAPSNEDAYLLVSPLSKFHYHIYISRVYRRCLPATATATASHQAKHKVKVKLKITLPENILQTKIGPLLQIKILTVSHLLQLNQFLQIFQHILVNHPVFNISNPTFDYDKLSSLNEPHDEPMSTDSTLSQVISNPSRINTPVIKVTTITSSNLNSTPNNKRLYHGIE